MLLNDLPVYYRYLTKTDVSDARAMVEIRVLEGNLQTAF
jgi:hypothetical protein